MSAYVNTGLPIWVNCGGTWHLPRALHSGAWVGKCDQILIGGGPENRNPPEGARICQVCKPAKIPKVAIT